MLEKPDISKFPKLQRGYRLLDQTEVVVEGDKVCSRLSDRWTSICLGDHTEDLIGKTLIKIYREYPYITGACRKIT